jgi:hypothetical protein
VGVILSRRWSYFRRTFIEALASCWKLRKHVATERKKLRAIRKRGDFWMLRFFTFRLNRWGEIKHMIKLGPPILDAR